MLRCGLLGRTLGHSYSHAIHKLLGDYSYDLLEVEPEGLEGFLRSGPFDALNVTIPYKKAVISYCAALSETAAAIGSVNTLVRRPDGTLFGDNTDAFGFSYMVRKSGIDVTGKKCLVFGSGGASVTVQYVLKQLGAGEVTVISRSGDNNYGNLYRHTDARILVNTTPLGMYPGNGTSPADLSRFPCCEGVLDVVYNPARTALLFHAEALSIPHAGGLSMLVAQAKRASEVFTGTVIPDSVIGSIEKKLCAQMQNVILIGMPGCGKTTVGRLLAEKLGRPFFDADEELEKIAGKPIPEIFLSDGEDAFRRLETEILCKLGKSSGAVIATGGGCVTRVENYALLHQNGTIIRLTRELDRLSVAGRPISQKTDLSALYESRRPFYEAFSDFCVSNDEAPEACTQKIMEALQ